jgi:hypothetical protein
MTDKFAPWVIAVILSVMFWTWLAQQVMGDSRQTCETVQSVETCAWELR